MIELGAGFDQELSGIENIWMACRLMGASNDLIKSKLDDIIAFAELGDFIYAPVKTYSSGMYMRLGFACSTVINPEILLIDEILAVGDVKFQKKCLDRIHQIKSDGKTIVIVSHDQSIVESLCDRAVFLWAGKVVYDGKPSIAFKVYNRLLANYHLHESPQSVVDEVLRLETLTSSSAAAAKSSIRVNGCSINGGLKAENGRRLIEIECSFNLSEPLDQAPTIGFQLRHKSQGRVYGANTRNDDFQSKFLKIGQSKSGTFYIKWQYDCTILSTGRYVVDICISNFEITQVFEFISEAFFFDIINPRESINADINLVELDAVHFSAALLN
jgi:ABC-type multidrug transport system ATPase subunit